MARDLNDDEKKVLSLLKQFAAAEKESLVMREIQKENSGVVSEWELGDYQLFENEINFFEAEKTDQGTSTKPIRHLMRGDYFRFSDNFGDQDVAADYQEMSRARQTAANPGLISRQNKYVFKNAMVKLPPQDTKMYVNKIIADANWSNFQKR
jgi:hypothetical protein